jgi:pimeloyl-ACP methyl ester carboxylesterase
MKSKHFILAPLYLAPPVLVYLAANYLAVADNLRAVPLLFLAGLCLIAVYARGLQLEERNEYLEPLAPTPLWGKRLPPWARDVLPEAKAPQLKLVGREDPITGIRMKALEWPGNPSNVPSTLLKSDDEDTETEPMAG